MRLLTQQESNESEVMRELCRIIRHLGSGIMLSGERSGLLTHIVTTESVSLCTRMKSRLRLSSFSPVGIACRARQADMVGLCESLVTLMWLTSNR
jgi:hypothetical protein